MYLKIRDAQMHRLGVRFVKKLVISNQLCIEQVPSLVFQCMFLDENPGDLPRPTWGAEKIY